MQIRKNKKTLAPPAVETKQSTERSFAWAVGSELFRHRDPLYHVTESFQQTFDRIGRSHAQAALGGFSETDRRAEENERAAGQGSREKERKDRGEAGRPNGKGMQDRGDRRFRTGDIQTALTRFSDTAFQRGAMSASVLNGTGKMMLVSCLKRTVGNGPKRMQQQTLKGTGSQMRNIPGRSPDQMVFNRSFAKGAVGIVVDTVRDARRVVDSMTEMAQGTGELLERDSATLRAMYPFLDNSRDLTLEAEYREKLAHCKDEREKPILQNALAQVLALKAKKAQMKNEFINKLRLVSDRATETLAELEAPGALDEIITSVWGDREPDLPENPGEGDGNAPDGPADGTGEAVGTGQGPGGTEAEP
ncbi:MAG: hypothetical protein E7425_08485 [Ruminococcaceae bacterium]|jgi:hypothetical protein|nr:hypothetical protein [Oscillospiraceae bacterium]